MGKTTRRVGVKLIRQRHYLATHTPLTPGDARTGVRLTVPRLPLDSRGVTTVHQMFDLSDIGLEPVFIHAGGAHDQLVGITRRVLKTVNPLNKSSSPYYHFRKALNKIGHSLGKTSEMSESKFVSYYSGRLKGKYDKAASELLADGLCSKDYRIKTFVKKEKWDCKTFVEKAPRIIQYQSPKFNISLGCFLKPIEKRIYKMKRKAGKFKNLPKTRVVCKGLNQKQRAKLFLHKAKRFNNLRVVSLDLSGMDLHTQEMQYDLFRVYRMCNSSPKLAKLLKVLVNQRARADSGVSYTLGPQTTSGRIDTATLNCLLMVGMVIGFFDYSQVTKFDLMDDGDDCLLMIEEEDVAKVELLIPYYFYELGHESKCGGAVRLEDAEFCHTKLVGGKMIRDWRKVLRTCFSSYKHYHNVGGFRVMKSIAQCELSLGVGVPIVQEFFQCWLEKFTHLEAAVLDVTEGSYLRARLERRDYWNAEPEPITESMRLDFERAWGISPQQQRGLECFLRAEIDKYPLAVLPTAGSQDMFLDDVGWEFN